MYASHTYEKDGETNTTLHLKIIVNSSRDVLGTQSIGAAGKVSSPPAPVLANEAELYILRRRGALYSRPPYALASAANYNT